MAETKTADVERDARGRLLDATERLIAGNGVELVSMRDINVAASAPIASTHYHFSSKYDIVSAAVSRRAESVQRDRLSALGDLLTDPTPDLWEFTIAFAMPLIRLDRSIGGHHWLGMMSRLFTSERSWRELAATAFHYGSDEINDTLIRAIPGATRQIVQFRRSVASSVVIGPNTRFNFNVSTVPHLDVAERELATVNLVYAVFNAPLHDRPIPTLA